MLPPVAPREPKSLLECNVILALGSMLTDEELAAGKKLPVMRQARLMVKALPKATRVGEFVAMWTVAKYQTGSTTVEELAEFWDEPVRTMYRRLAEFRDVWGAADYDTPDRLADGLIGDFRRRRERMNASHVARLLGADVPLPASAIASSLGR
jgi:hypothetical protein